MLRLSHYAFFATSQTVRLLLSCLTDGAARIFSYHLMPRLGRDSNSRQQACTTLWDLNSGPLYQLSYCDRGKRLKLSYKALYRIGLLFSAFSASKSTRNFPYCLSPAPIGKFSVPKFRRDPEAVSNPSDRHLWGHSQSFGSSQCTKA